MEVTNNINNNNNDIASYKQLVPIFQADDGRTKKKANAMIPWLVT